MVRMCRFADGYLTPPERESGVERIWRSRAFWYSAAAVMLLSLMLSGRRIGFAAAPVDTFEPSAEAVAAAEEISAVAGDGKATYDNLVRQFARATTEPVECAYDQQGLLEGL